MKLKDNNRVNATFAPDFLLICLQMVHLYETTTGYWSALGRGSQWNELGGSRGCMWFLSSTAVSDNTTTNTLIITT